MHVRKFEADSLEEALKEIKKELGPDAIILKTVTNKGLKGAFKKKKIEITAAISEKNYAKKLKVDTVLNDSQRDQFYGNNSSYISNMIDEHATHQTAPSGYGKLALNRAVRTTEKKAEPNIGRDLDKFLGAGNKVIEEEQLQWEQPVEIAQEPAAPVFSQSYDVQRVEKLERQLFDLQKKLTELTAQKAPVGIVHLGATLRSLDISEQYIQSLIRKATFELAKDELENADVVFEFALHEMLKVVKTRMPLFASTDNGPVITILMSETSCGQTSMMLKLGALKKDSVLIKNVDGAALNEGAGFIEKIFNMEVVKVRGLSEMISECRRAQEAGKAVFIDYRNRGDSDESKKFIDGIRRTFDRVEVLISLSAIHSEIYNRKVVSRYRSLADGVVISHLDLCLNFGALFNIAEKEKEIPFKFYGTGEIIPDDLEAATAERILAGIFQL